jgi:flavin reductase (DIM6/NTAB) family NADH-FMN oxidoreductase RutF
LCLELILDLIKLGRIYEKVSWAQDAHLSYARVGGGHLRQGRQGQRDDRLLGRHLLLAAALYRCVLAPGDLLLRQYSRTQAFTISIPSADFVKQADYFGLVSGRNTDKLAATKLTAKKSDLVDAPYVKEFPVVLECQLVHVFDLGLHTQFIGEVLDAKVEEAVMGMGASVEIKKVNPLVFVPDTQDYYGIGEFVGKVFSVGQGI